jgi:phosphatidylglycerophosphate synthase
MGWNRLLPARDGLLHFRLSERGRAQCALSRVCQHLHYQCRDRFAGFWNANLGSQCHRHGPVGGWNVPDGNLKMNTTENIVPGAEARRPLKIRNVSGWQLVASALVKRGVTPNTISVIGLVVGMAAGVSVAATAVEGLNDRFLLLAALLCMAGRGFCNILDGVMAMELGAGTRVGALYNEVPDRLSDAAVLVGAGYAVGGVPVLGWAAALAAVFTAYVRVQGQVAGATADYRGLFGKPGRMLVLAACMLLLLVFPKSADLELLIGTNFSMGVFGAGTALIAIGSAFTAALRLRRSASELSQLPGINS